MSSLESDRLDEIRGRIKTELNRRTDESKKVSEDITSVLSHSGCEGNCNVFCTSTCFGVCVHSCTAACTSCTGCIDGCTACAGNGSMPAVGYNTRKVEAYPIISDKDGYIYPSVVPIQPLSLQPSPQEEIPNNILTVNGIPIDKDDKKSLIVRVLNKLFKKEKIQDTWRTDK